MKIRAQIFALLLLLVLAFATGLLSLREYSRRSILKLARDQAYSQNLAFDGFLKNRSASLTALASPQFPEWDELVRAVTNDDAEWARRSLGESMLRGYGANAFWVYRPDFTLFHSVNNIPATELDNIPLPTGATLEDLCRMDRAEPFFVRAPQGLMEVHRAVLRPSWDVARETPPAGFLFIARLWSNADLKEVSLLTGHLVHITPAESVPPASHDEHMEGVITFQRDLLDWQGKPIAKLLVRSETPIIREFNRDARRLFYLLAAFAAALFIIVSGVLRNLVTLPLTLIIHSLRNKDLAALQRIEKRSTEFGELALLIRNFFQQRDELVREMNERKAAERALRHSEEQLRHSQKMEAIGRLAGGVAHDFNNLLTAIIGYAELLHHQLAGNPLQQKAQLIRKAGEQAAGLTRQLLAFSRKQLLQPRVIDLNQLVTEMEKLLRRIIGEHIEIITQANAATGRIRADPHQIEQVLLNLGVNARDAMPSGGQLIIRTEKVELAEEAAEAAEIPPGQYVLLEMKDTGEGMTAETKARLFEPFFTTKGPGKGTGLGLATVYGIVKQSDGGISVESAPSAGSIFRIYFPTEAAPVEPARAAPAPPAPTKNRETVLVVEDEEVVRDLVCDVLRQQGYSVLAAGSGEEALALSARHAGTIDLLITDMVMPQMNGYLVAQNLAAQRPGIRVLYVSGYSEQDISEHGVDAEHIEVLQKPFTPNSLARKVRDALG
jgi:signal transduction histidine kinase